MNRLRKPALIHALLGMAAAWGFTLGAAAPAHAQIWSEYAMVSATMGVSDGRVCVGEGSRGDIGCPTYAPYISATSGYVGIGTAPFAPLVISDSGSYISFRPGIYYDTGGFVSNTNYTNIDLPGNRFLNFSDNVIMYGGSALWSRPRLGVNVLNPSTSLHVSGSIVIGYEVSTTMQTCDINRTGAIKYQSGDFYYCRNGTAWESLTSLSGGGGTAGDRITSGTTGVYTYTTGKASVATAGVERMVVDANGNVGIGQQPATNYPLSVSGSLSITSSKVSTSEWLMVVKTSQVSNSSGFYKSADDGGLNFDMRDVGVVCGRGRNPTLRLWPAIFSGEIDVFPSERRNMGQEIGR